MTKQQIYKANARYLGKKTDADRKFSKFLLTVLTPTKNQRNNPVYDKLEGYKPSPDIDLRPGKGKQVRTTKPPSDS